MMDSYMRHQLDRYIQGDHIHDEDGIPHKCPTCGTTRAIPMFYELGGWFYKDDSDYCCENCGREMDIIEESQCQQ